MRAIARHAHQVRIVYGEELNTRCAGRLLGMRLHGLCDMTGHITNIVMSGGLCWTAPALNHRGNTQCLCGHRAESNMQSCCKSALRLGTRSQGGRKQLDESVIIAPYEAVPVAAWRLPAGIQGILRVLLVISPLVHRDVLYPKHHLNRGRNLSCYSQSASRFKPNQTT